MPIFLTEDWAQHLADIKQPMLLLNATGAFGPSGAAPVLPREHALETVHAVSDGRYVQISGNHMTMLFEEGAKQIVDAITTFVHASLKRTDACLFHDFNNAVIEISGGQNDVVNA